MVIELERWRHSSQGSKSADAWACQRQFGQDTREVVGSRPETQPASSGRYEVLQVVSKTLPRIMFGVGGRPTAG